MLCFFFQQVEIEDRVINTVLSVDFAHFLNIIDAESKIKDARDKLPTSYTYENMIRTLVKAHNVTYKEAEKLTRYDYVLEMCLSAVENAQQIIQSRTNK